MRVAHFSRFGPNRSGQYGTVKDLIKAEIGQGIDAGLVPVLDGPAQIVMDREGLKDGWLETKGYEWAKKADIFVRHTVIPPEFMAIPKPKVMVLHGRPENSFMLGRLNRTPVYQIVGAEQQHKLSHAFITFWEDYLFHWSYLVDKNRLFYIPAPVDLERYTSEGEKYDFGSDSGEPNIVVADLWREDTTPYNILHAAALFRKKYCPTAKIHIFGLEGAPNGPICSLAGILQNAGDIGRCHTRVNNIEEALRAADIVITPQHIATRTIREALACNTPVVASSGCEYTPYTADARNTELFAFAINDCWEAIKGGSEQSPRKVAEDCFNLEQTGKAMTKLFDKLIAGKLEYKLDKSQKSGTLIPMNTPANRVPIIPRRIMPQHLIQPVEDK